MSKEVKSKELKKNVQKVFTTKSDFKKPQKRKRKKLNAENQELDERKAIGPHGIHLERV